jgi:hypothetical protein
MAWQDIVCLAIGGFFAVRWKQVGADMHRSLRAADSTPVRAYQIGALVVGVTMLAGVVLARVLG